MIDIRTAIETLHKERPMLRILKGYENKQYYSFFVVARKWNGNWEDYPIGIETYYSIDKKTGKLNPTAYHFGEDDPGKEINIAAYLTKEDQVFIEHIKKTREAYDNDQDYFEV